MLIFVPGKSAQGLEVPLRCFHEAEALAALMRQWLADHGVTDIPTPLPTEGQFDISDEGELRGVALDTCE